MTLSIDVYTILLSAFSIPVLLPSQTSVTAVHYSQGPLELTLN